MKVVPDKPIKIGGVNRTHDCCFCAIVVLHGKPHEKCCQCWKMRTMALPLPGVTGVFMQKEG